MINIVAALLIFMEPLRFAAEVLAITPTLAYRGSLAIVELITHGLVAALSATAGFALVNKSPDGRRLAALAIVVVTLRAIQSLTWSVLPNNTSPGSELLSLGVTIAASTIAFVVVRRRSHAGN